MWLIAEYAPTSLFSLKPAWATSSGGKSLLLPTPYAIKMALLDAACRLVGVEEAAQWWLWIRGLRVAMRGPDQIVVTNTFTKILKPRRGSPPPGSADAGPLQKTIGFREYVYFSGLLGLALETNGSDNVSSLMELIIQINYLGKRGGFVQLLPPPQVTDTLPTGYNLISSQDQDSFYANGVAQPLDDAGAEATFSRVNIYSGKYIRQGKDRILHHVILPYRLAHSSRGYSLYERISP